MPVISKGPGTEPPGQAAAHSSTRLFKEVFEIWGAQSLLFVLVFSKVSEHGHDFVFKDFWGWFCFCKRRTDRKNCQSILGHEDLET